MQRKNLNMMCHLGFIIDAACSAIDKKKIHFNQKTNSQSRKQNESKPLIFVDKLMKTIKFPKITLKHLFTP